MTFPRYPKYKDSGVEWLGEVPAHWDFKKTKFLFDIQSRPPTENEEIVTAFRDGIVTLRANRRVDGFTNSDKEIGYQGVRVNDLVIHAMDAFAGAIGVSDSDGKSTPVYSVCKAHHESVVPLYYARLLRTMALSGFISSLAKGIRERSTEFRWKEAGNLMLPVPSAVEQKDITTFLDRETAKIDDLIYDQKKLIELLQEKRQALISHAVTKGLNPDAPMRDSGVEWLGEVPEHWGVKTIRYFAEILRGKFTHRPRNDPEFYGGDFPFVQTGDITGAARYITGYKQTLNHKGTKVSKEFPKGTLVMAIAANIGSR